MIAQLQINRVIEIIKDYTTFYLYYLFIYLDVQSQNDISTILLARVEYKIHEIG